MGNSQVKAFCPGYPMSIKTKCDGCGKSYQVDDKFAGKKAKCKACGQVMVVPAAGAAAAPAKSAGAPQRSTSKPGPRKAEVAAAEFDFSAIDDIESSGTIDHSYQPPPVAVVAPKVDRSRGTPAPAFLRQGGTAKNPGKPIGPIAHAPGFVESLKPGPVGFAFLGLLLVGIACLVNEKAAGFAAIGLGVIGILCCLISKFTTISLARDEGFTVYLLYRFVPFYGIYFVCSRWDEARQAALTWMKGAVLLTLAIVLLIRGGGTSEVFGQFAMKSKATAKTTPAAQPVEEDQGALDGTADGMRKYAAFQAAKSAKKRQADLDNVAWQPFPVVAFPKRTKLPELGELQTGTMDHYAWDLHEEYLGEPCRFSLWMSTGQHPPHSLPCVVMSAQTDDPLFGGSFVEADMEEVAGFVESGFAVLMYETTQFSPLTRPRERWGSVAEFMRTEGGKHIANTAMNVLEARADMVDMKRVYAVGHESSATFALNLAADDPRIHAVATYNPRCDVIKALGAPIATVEKEIKISGLREFANRISPINRVKDINCPVLILTAEEAPSSEGDAAAFNTAMRAAGRRTVGGSVKPEPDKPFIRGTLAPKMAQWLKSLQPTADAK